MRLLSATVRNYRIHRELTVYFDETKNLITGKNETGKSTLIEAIHRALFLKATVTGKILSGMKSETFPGNPEIQVRFIAGESDYKLMKRFDGSRGTTLLVQVEGNTWHGEEAESRLYGLLGMEDGITGRLNLDRLAKQWSHIWVWQGQSGNEPSEHIALQNDRLLKTLQQVGGLVAVQSELDGKVANSFTRLRDEIFTERQGKLKKGSSYYEAERELQQAEENKTQTFSRLEALRGHIEKCEDANASIKTISSELEKLQKKQKKAAGEMDKVKKLEEDAREKKQSCKYAEKQLENLEGIENDIKDLRETVGSLQESLKPDQEHEEQLKIDVKAAEKGTAKYYEKYKKASAETRRIRLRRDLASACVELFAKKDLNADLQHKVKRVKGLKKELLKLNEDLAGLASVEEGDLKELRSLEIESGKLSERLEAMATGIEVVASDKTVRIGERELYSGEKVTVSETTEIKAGDSLHIRIHPGGETLDDVRKKLASLQESLQGKLDRYVLGSVEEVSDTFVKREDILSEADRLRAHCEELGDQELTESYDRANIQLVAAKKKVKRLSVKVVDAVPTSTLREANHWPIDEDDALIESENNEAVSHENYVDDDLVATGAEVECRSVQLINALPATSEEANRWLIDEDDALIESENNETVSQTKYESVDRSLKDLKGKLEELSDSIAGESGELSDSEARLRFLLEKYGDDEARATTLKNARSSKKKVEVALGKIDQSIENLDPEVLKLDIRRLGDAYKEQMRLKQEKEKALAVSQSALVSDGREDPYAENQDANVRLQTANERLEIQRRGAEAVRRVDEIFKQQQTALSDRLSGPLAQKVTEYLKHLYGRGAHALVTFENDRFKGVTLTRSASGRAEPFDVLSSGTREQVAAAVRLAIAELLAAEYDGSLPVVFDDAFAYSDSDRIDTLQKMLHFASSRGLQLIVLTCKPSDYASLGARQRELPQNT